jgi:hypothetical protein
MVVRLAGVALSALRELHAAGIVGRSSEVTDARHLGVAVTHCSLLFGLVFAGWSAAALARPAGSVTVSHSTVFGVWLGVSRGFCRRA